MQYIGEIIDNILYLEDENTKYKCVFLKTGFKMKKQILKNNNPFATIDLKINSFFKASYLINYIDSNSLYTLEYKGLYPY